MLWLLTAMLWLLSWSLRGIRVSVGLEPKLGVFGRSRSIIP